jgi:membrane-bound serine protease (ClpP class)
MKRILVVILSALVSLNAFSNESTLLIYRIRLDQDIDKSSQRLVSMGLEKGISAGADYFLLDLDTYGGAVDAADSIRSAILHCPKPVVAYVNMQAA